MALSIQPTVVPHVDEAGRQWRGLRCRLLGSWSGWQETPMLKWALIFLVIALVAGMLGFFVLGTTAALIAKVLFVIFLILFIVGLITGRGRPVVP
jgi:uncharacterized membrane protein YtjA (UPF0391 family)